MKIIKQKIYHLTINKSRIKILKKKHPNIFILTVVFLPSKKRYGNIRLKTLVLREVTVYFLLFFFIFFLLLFSIINYWYIKSATVQNCARQFFLLYSGHLKSWNIFNEKKKCFDKEFMCICKSCQSITSQMRYWTFFF